MPEPGAQQAMGFRKWELERLHTAKTRGACDSELVDDLHELIHFSVHGRLAVFQMLLHADAGKEGQDYFCQYGGFHRGLLGCNIFLSGCR
jgi:hypothetical protein